MTARRKQVGRVLQAVGLAALALGIGIAFGYGIGIAVGGLALVVLGAIEESG